MKKNIKFKGTKFLFLVIIIYILLFFYNQDMTLQSALKSYEVLFQLLPIFVMIIVITTMINLFLKPKAIMKHFGKDSGFKAWIYATIGGIISHGPMFAWYSMLKELRSNGLKDGLLATFMFTRSIKLPFIPIMIDYFGILFTCLLFFYIVVVGVLQGILVEILSKK